MIDVISEAEKIEDEEMLKRVVSGVRGILRDRSRAEVMIKEADKRLEIIKNAKSYEEIIRYIRVCEGV